MSSPIAPTDNNALSPLGASAKAVTALAASALAFLPLLPRLASLPCASALATLNALLRREAADTRVAERCAAAERARPAGFFEHLPGALFVVRPGAGRFVFETVNPSFRRLFGRAGAVVEGRGPDTLLEPEAAAALERRFAACPASGRTLDRDTPAGGAPGVHHWRTVLVPLPAGADGVSRLLGSLREVPGDTEELDAAPPLAAAVEVARRAWALEGLDISLEISAPLTQRGRPSQFEQAVLHLLENAREAVLRRRQAAPDALARIAVRLAPGAVPGTVVVSVRDTGGGVPASVAPHVLDPFVTGKEPGEGTGLGLPIAAGIARGLGGRVSWSNVAFGRPEAGAMFRLAFPAAASGAASGRVA